MRGGGNGRGGRGRGWEGVCEEGVDEGWDEVTSKGS